MLKLDDNNIPEMAFSTDVEIMLTKFNDNKDKNACVDIIVNYCNVVRIFATKNKRLHIICRRKNSSTNRFKSYEFIEKTTDWSSLDIRISDRKPSHSEFSYLIAPMRKVRDYREENKLSAQVKELSAQAKVLDNRKIVTRYYINLSSERINVITGYLHDDIDSQGRVEFRPLNSNVCCYVSHNEGVVLYNSFWLSERNDELANSIIKKQVNLAARKPNRSYCDVLDFEMITA